MADLPIETFSQRLRWGRICSGLTGAQLAERAGIDASTVSRIERGERQGASALVVAALAEALGIPMGWLWTGDGEEPEPGAIRAHVGEK